MRISTSEFMLSSLNDILSQQQTVNQLNREIATGETLLQPSDDPGGASEVIGLSNQLGSLAYDAANGQAATQTLQNGVSALTQVSNLLDQLQTNVEAVANGNTTPADRQAAIANAQETLQQLVQLGNTQGPNGGYLFAGTKSNAPPFSLLSSGQVVFNGDAGVNQVEIAPSLNVAATVSGQGIFMNVPAGSSGIAVSASGGNTGSAYALADGVTNISQVNAAALAGTEYNVTFSGSGASLTYQVTSGTGIPGSAGYNATSGVVASGSFAPGAGSSDIAFAGLDIGITGTPAAGDSFSVQPGASSSIFQTVQSIVSALQLSQNGAGANGLGTQALQSILANINAAQNSVLAAQGTLGTGLSQIQSVQNETTTMSATATTQLSNVQSANLPAVLANYSESLTALQASQLAFAKVQGLSLFNDISP